jgi:hypothetical protein
MALQGGHRFPVSMDDLYPDGLYAMSVEEAQDYDEKTGGRTPAKDKLTGERVYNVTCYDRGPDVRPRDRQVTVKVSAPVQPVLPGEVAPGTGLHAVVFAGLTVTRTSARTAPGLGWPTRSGRPGCTPRARPPPIRPRRRVVPAGWRPAARPARPVTGRLPDNGRRPARGGTSTHLVPLHVCCQPLAPSGRSPPAPCTAWIGDAPGSTRTRAGGAAPRNPWENLDAIPS